MKECRAFITICAVGLATPVIAVVGEEESELKIDTQVLMNLYD